VLKECFRLRKQFLPPLSHCFRFAKAKLLYVLCLVLQSSLNPDFYNWNAVFAHYCSSDSWLGNRPKDEDTDWHFMGYNIMWGVLNSLVEKHNLGDATQILTTGMSVGSVGLFNNVDRMVDFYNKHAPRAEHFFIADSSWMLLGWTWGSTESEEGANGQAQYDYQNPVLADNCVAAGYTWECYYPAQYQFATIDHIDNLIVAEQMYDKMKIGFEFGDPYETWTKDMWEFAVERCAYVIDSITSQAKNWFVSNCRAHDTINHADWYLIQIEDEEGVPRNWSSAAYDYTAAHGKEPLQLMDEERMPESNPTCVFDQLEWNYVNCGDFWTSDC